VHLGCTFLLALAFSVVPSLTADLFQPAEVTLSSREPLALNMAFDGSTVEAFDIRPAYDVASASRIYSGTLSPWRTIEYTFQPLSVVSVQTDNVTANVTGFPSYDDCVAIPRLFHYDMEKAKCYFEGESLLDGRIVLGELTSRGGSGFWRRLKKRLKRFL
jgi:hypothetical protein